MRGYNVVTKEQLIEIIVLLRNENRSIDISRKFNINKSTVSHIKQKYCPELIKSRQSISDETKAEILKLILDDWAYANYLKIHEKSVGYIARKNNIPKKNNRAKLIPKETDEKIIELITSGMSVSDVAIKSGVSDWYVYQLCKSENLTNYLANRNPLTDEEKNEINKLYEEGYKGKVICEKMNISDVTLYSNVIVNRNIIYDDEQIKLLYKLVFDENVSIIEASEIVDMRLYSAYRYIERYKEERNLK